jgi:AGCS family alanine or glycine:cation symporter
LLFWSKYRFVEATLAQIYKEKHLGEFRGGLLLYRERIRREMVCCFICRGFYHFGVLSGVQANSVADGIQNAFEIDTWKSGIVVSLIFGAIVGKNRQIHRICRPIMAIIYIVIVLVIIVIDIDQLPGVIALVLKVLLTWKLVLEPFWFSSSMGCKKEDLF